MDARALRHESDFPDVDELLIGIPSEIAATLAYTSSTFVVLTAHDYKYDLPVLKVVLPARPAYVGLSGQQATWKSDSRVSQGWRDGREFVGPASCTDWPGYRRRHRS